MVLLQAKCWENDFYRVRRDSHGLLRTVCYRIGESARDTVRKWKEEGRHDDIKDECGGILSEERQAELAQLNLYELLDVLFFQSRMASTLQVFPENRTQAMSNLEDVVVRVLETIPTEKEVATKKAKALQEVHQGEKGLYLPSQHKFKKHGKDYAVDIEVNLGGTEVGKFFFVTDHPDYGSPAVYFNHQTIYANAPQEANACVLGEMKRIGRGKELSPRPDLTGETCYFIWSPICANTRIAPINLPEHTQKYEGFCIVPVKYFAVDNNVLQDVLNERKK